MAQKALLAAVQLHNLPCATAGAGAGALLLADYGTAGMRVTAMLATYRDSRKPCQSSLIQMYLIATWTKALAGCRLPLGMSRGLLLTVLQKIMPK